MRYTGGSKWKKHKLMMKNIKVQPHLPETAKFTPEILWNYLRKYNKVVLKPVIGRRGRNILKVSRLGESQYEIHFKNKKSIYTSEKDTLAYIERFIRNRKHILQRTYIVQRYIDLATYENKPFDIRVIVQKRKRSSEWHVTGMVSKVAGKGFMITNDRSGGGIILPVTSALRKANDDIARNRKEIMKEIERVVLIATKNLASYWKKQTIMGLDVGIDKKGHVWIIEGNLCPGIKSFYKLKDKTMYRIIKNIRRENKKKLIYG